MDDVDELFDEIAMNVAPVPPNASRFQPRIKGKDQVKVGPPRRQLQSLVPKTLQPEAESPELDKNQSLEKEPILHSTTGNRAATAETEAENNLMDIDEDDVVVQEFDVYINPFLDADTKLYDTQYLLRPYWRPYELDERCQEIRFMPKLSHFEIDMSLDVDKEENYDLHSSSMRTTQTLLSESSPANEFAVGFLSGNQFHVNPLHAVVQFLPSLQGDNLHESNFKSVKIDNKESLKVSDIKRKTSFEDANEVNNQININESCVLLEYHSMDSPASCFYKQKAVSRERNHIPFAMQSSTRSSLGIASHDSIWKAARPSIKHLLSMPLEHRLKHWFSEGPQVNHFDALRYLAPSDSVKDVLKLLQLHAYLVQGLWVSKSSLVCHGDAVVSRDYILLQFSKNRAVRKDQLKLVKTEHWLKAFAVERTSFQDWKFKEDPDFLFIKQYPEIVEAEKHAWFIREKQILEHLRNPGKIPSIKQGISSKVIGLIDRSQNIKRNSVNNSETTTIPKGQDALQKAVVELLHLHKVLSLNSIIQGLQEKTSAGLPEFENALGHIAMKVHDVYVLKSLGKPALDQFRNVVIKYLHGKGRNAKLKKQEIKLAAQLHLKRDVSDADYIQVMNELCMSSGGSWTLKSGALTLV